jgi:flagellar basal-body rod modification protein FlgD
MNVTTEISSPDPNARPSSNDPVGDSRLGKDQFVELLMAQLAHQDPTAPQSNEAFIAQLAQFAQVELMQQNNSNLEDLMLASAAGNQIGVAQLVGKDVVYRTDEIEIKADRSIADLELNLPSDAANVVVTVKDSSGTTVDVEQLGQNGAGSVDFTWDGLDSHGNPIPPGTYTVEVVATGIDGAIIEGITVGARGHVDGVSFVDGAAQLILGALKIDLGDVVQVSEAIDPDANPSE